MIGGPQGPLREVLIACRMLRRRGLRATLTHVRSIGLARLHRLLFDRKLEDRLPRPVRGELPKGAIDLRTVTDAEVEAAVPHAPTPTKVLQWTLQGLRVDLRDFHFVDIGSGRGCAVVRAAMFPFRSVTGVEFAHPYHEDAVANVAWARASGLIKAGRVDLRHESALRTQLPDGPCLIFLYSPFEEVVMRPFLDLVDASVRRNPRPMLAIYVNPIAARAFARPGIAEIRLAGRERVLLRLFGPHPVKAYSWTV